MAHIELTDRDTVSFWDGGSNELRYTADHVRRVLRDHEDIASADTVLIGSTRYTMDYVRRAIKLYIRAEMLLNEGR